MSSKRMRITATQSRDSEISMRLAMEPKPKNPPSSKRSNEMKTWMAVKREPNAKPNTSLECSGERRATWQKPRPKCLGKPDGVAEARRRKQLLRPHRIHDKLAERAPCCSRAGADMDKPPEVVLKSSFEECERPEVEDCSAGAAKATCLAAPPVVRRRSSVRLRRSICASRSRRMLMKRTSVPRSRSRQRSATWTTVVQRSSSSGLATRMGCTPGSIEHSSNTRSQLPQKRRNCASNSSVLVFVPV
mmetsp:Transcript_15823/g.45117  ORF Transcript_15823/g.45117 Transcript_15823/m.45117 type:complete len:246 (-) Transcript_15823:688-1425(-)